MASSTELFPQDWSPTTTNWGYSISLETANLPSLSMASNRVTCLRSIKSCGTSASNGTSLGVLLDAQEGHDMIFAIAIGRKNTRRFGLI